MVEAQLISVQEAHKQALEVDALFSKCPEGSYPVAVTPLPGAVMYRCLLERIAKPRSDCRRCLFSGTIEVPLVVDTPQSGGVEESSEEVPIPIAVTNWPLKTSLLQIN